MCSPAARRFRTLAVPKEAAAPRLGHCSHRRRRRQGSRNHHSPGEVVDWEADSSPAATAEVLVALDSRRIEEEVPVEVDSRRIAEGEVRKEAGSRRTAGEADPRELGSHHIAVVEGDIVHTH